MSKFDAQVQSKIDMVFDKIECKIFKQICYQQKYFVIPFEPTFVNHNFSMIDLSKWGHRMFLQSDQ